MTDQTWSRPPPFRIVPGGGEPTDVEEQARRLLDDGLGEAVRMHVESAFGDAAAAAEAAARLDLREAARRAHVAVATLGLALSTAWLRAVMR